MMTTDDLVRAWLAPIKPYVRLIALLLLPIGATLDSVLAGELRPGRGLVIILGLLVASLDALFQRSPRRAALPAFTLPPLPPLPPAPPPVQDLPTAAAIHERILAAKLEIVRLADELAALERDVPRPPEEP